MVNSKRIVEINSLSKHYNDGNIWAVKDISLTLERGKIYALMGSSGCGKSTLLNLIGQLDRANSGAIYYEGKSVNSFNSISQFRREFMGFVFQFHHLIPVLTLYENIEAALLLNKTLDVSQKETKIKNLLTEMGLADKIDAMATEVSGGERQRAAIARALVNSPKLILADEPTGNVDSKTSIMILKKLRHFVDKQKSTMLIATHDAEVGKFADVIFRMQDGQIISVENG
ncbi:MAG: ABC transporter ATP-binding protein [Epsilonproteobacteria bacterium]|nr:ABC transporter ATP-binding protein [Campylobacterota bacterium]